MIGANPTLAVSITFIEMNGENRAHAQPLLHIFPAWIIGAADMSYMSIREYIFNYMVKSFHSSIYTENNILTRNENKYIITISCVPCCGAITASNMETTTKCKVFGHLVFTTSIFLNRT